MFKKNPLKLIFLSCFIPVAFFCAFLSPRIMTVTGPVPADRMGTTLEHEHLLVDFIGADSTGTHRWDRNKVVEKVLPYLMEAKRYGVTTLVDCTPAFLGRDPVVLKTLSERSGIFIVTNTGLYGAYGNKHVPRSAFDQTAEQIAGQWIREWEQGIDGSGIRPGFIKISVDWNGKLSDIHENLVRAAAKTHRKTGLAIASHTTNDSAAFEQIRMLKAEGVLPNAFIWVHAQAGGIQSGVLAAGQGVWISCDNVQADSANIRQTVEFLSAMRQAGLLDKVMVSHDAGFYDVGKPEGGEFRGFTAVFTHLIPALKAGGFSERDIRQIFVLNPAKAFAIGIHAG